MHEKVLVRTTAEGEDIYALINPATGEAIKANPIVFGTRNRPVTPTNPLIDTSNKAAGMTQCDSEVVVVNDHPSDGLRIGDFYKNKFGEEYQVIGIGPDGNPITARHYGAPDSESDKEEDDK